MEALQNNNTTTTQIHPLTRYLFWPTFHIFVGIHPRIVRIVVIAQFGHEKRFEKVRSSPTTGPAQWFIAHCQHTQEIMHDFIVEPSAGLERFQRLTRTRILLVLRQDVVGIFRLVHGFLQALQIWFRQWTQALRCQRLRFRLSCRCYFFLNLLLGAF